MRITTLISIFYINLKLFFLKIFNPKKIVPYKILINLTDLCNSRCNFCDIWKIKPKNEINLENIIRSFDAMKKSDNYFKESNLIDDELTEDINIDEDDEWWK